MDLVLQPYVGLGPVRFGMRRADVRRSVGGVARTFKRGPGDSPLVDAFDDEGIYVYYDSQDLCEAAEAASPANPLFDGRQLVGKPFADVRDWLLSRDPETKIDESGLTSLAFGLGLYAPHAQKEPDQPVEAAIAFRRGYYD